MNLEKEFTRINGALTNFENGQHLSQDLAKIQQELINNEEAIDIKSKSILWLEDRYKKMKTLADNLAELVGEMHGELANWDPKAGEEFEKKFNEAMKIK